MTLSSRLLFRVDPWFLCEGESRSSYGHVLTCASLPPAFSVTIIVTRIIIIIIITTITIIGFCYHHHNSIVIITIVIVSVGIALWITHRNCLLSSYYVSSPVLVFLFSYHLPNLLCFRHDVMANIHMCIPSLRRRV
jgi:hypothetical protein